MAITRRKKKTTNTGEDLDNEELAFTALRDRKLCGHYRSQSGRSSKH